MSEKKPKQKKPKKPKKLSVKEQCDEYLNGWKRAQADYKNLQQSTDEWKNEFVKFANEGLIHDLLPVLNNFKAAFTQVPENEKDSAWVVGFSYIKKQMEEMLRNNGVEEMKTVGEKFDTTMHEAVENRFEKDKDENIVLEEKMPGYKLKDKVIQAAKVVVNSKEKEKKGSEEEK